MRDLKAIKAHDRKIEQLKQLRKTGIDPWIVVAVTVAGVLSLIWLLSRL